MWTCISEGEVQGIGKGKILDEKDHSGHSCACRCREDDPGGKSFIYVWSDP